MPFISDLIHRKGSRATSRVNVCGRGGGVGSEGCLRAYGLELGALMLDKQRGILETHKLAIYIYIDYYRSGQRPIPKNYKSNTGLARTQAVTGSSARSGVVSGITVAISPRVSPFLICGESC